jgi:hypothetical protein
MARLQNVTKPRVEAETVAEYVTAVNQLRVEVLGQ